VPNIEILTFEECPNRDRAVALVERVVADASGDVEVAIVDVPDAGAAERLRFLGSPTIRVDGRDIEPGGADRTDYVYGCRVYRTDAGLTGIPDERWLRDALARAA
jgi:hypothetical protein